MNICMEDGCTQPAVARNMCRRHYAADYAANGPAKPHSKKGGERRTSQLDKNICGAIPGCAHPTRGSGDRSRAWCCTYHGTLARKYTLSPERLYALLQETACGICGVQQERPMSIDHDHTCCPGKTSCGECVRGMICNPCNVRLGYYEGSVDWTDMADAYLAQYR